ncbi:flagellar hook-length control protein FliK [Romboutsia lituseburensis]|uniref:Hook-length control protein FliK n=1 Tax=Romboutsia lituseburensis DSM 797 TaxID=1121325 RepID=A0A1G9PAL0_9FIRM|nr:flagellar hook-length control protein FliK [Romboutsia lituseburensis]CEH33308.1 Flagellar hook-length control protein FliK [Romboutsia lituseburensis]SDL95798.1 hook-length control protein FliK [Romboutsia lituseburensis DSM 797]
MDMNLNISMQIMNNFQGSANGSTSSSSKDQFEGLLNALKTNVEDSELTLNTNDNTEDVDYTLIQQLMNLLQQIGQIDESGKLNLLDKDTDVKLDNLVDFVKNQNINQLQSNDIDNLLESLVKSGEMKLTSPENLNEEVLNKIKEILNSKSSNKGTLDNVKSNNNVLDSLNEENKVQDTNKSLDIDFTQINKKQEQNSYEQLDIMTLNTKSNIIKTTESDKDLNTLEDILGEKNNNQFMLSPGVQTTSTTNENTEVITNPPVKEIRQEFIGDDVVKTVRYLKANGLEEINIKISPRELGEMTIKLIKHAEETKVAITISKDDVFDLVNKNVGDIVKHLNDLNIKVKEVSVDIKNDNQKFFSDNLNQEFERKNHQNQKRRNKNINNIIEDIEDSIESRLDEDNLNILI